MVTVHRIVMVSLASVVMSVAVGCGSIVSDDVAKNTALDELKDWHYQAGQITTLQPKDQAKYDAVQKAVEKWIGDKKKEANELAARPFGGTIDLRMETLPSSAVTDGRKLFGRSGQAVAADIYVIIKDLLKESREQSALSVGRKLDELQLPARPSSQPASTAPAPK